MAVGLNFTQLLILALSWTSIDVVYAQTTCSDGVQVYQRSPSNSVRLDVHADRIIEVATSEVPTSACRRVCDSTPSCRSFSVDYTTRTCKIFSVTVPRSRLIQRPGAAFFEKICLPNASADRIRRKCGTRMWAVERVSGLAFNAFVSRLQEDVVNRETCIRVCLEETAFECASVTYDGVTRACALSATDRHTHPTAISANARSSDYFENECVNNLVDCRFLAQSDVKVVSVDYVTVARSEDECRDDCQQNTAMICRSYSYDVAKNSCSLSSDNSVSLLGVELPTQIGHLYADRQCQHSGSSPSVFGANEIALSLQTSAMSRGLEGSFSGGFPGMASVSSNQFLPGHTGFGFGNQFPQVQTSRFNNFDAGANPNNFFPQNTGSFNQVLPTSPTSFGGFNNRFLPGQGTFDRPFLGSNDPRMFGSPRDGNTFNTNNQFSNGFPVVSDGCSLEKSTGLTVMPDPRSIIPTDGLGRGVTVQCAILCRLQGPIQCPAFTVDYTSNQCVALNRPAQAALSTGSTPTQSYFEQVCYNTVYRTCQGKAWSFERMVNTELRGFNDRLLPSIATRQDCEEACLKETQFPCLSAEYDGNRFECRLSRESRLTRSYALQQSPNVDYLENQCVPPASTNTCNPARQQGQAVFYVDASLPQVPTEEECKGICRALPNFTCVAASYIQTTRECQLSNDVTVFSQADSVVLYSSCLNPVQVAAPNFGNNGQSFSGNAFNNQFPGSFGSPGFNGRGTNFGGGFGGVPQSSGFMPPNQFHGNFNPVLNTGFSQRPFFNPNVPQQIPQMFETGTNTFVTPTGQATPFGAVLPTFQNQNSQFFGTGVTNFPNRNPQAFGPSIGTSSFIPQQNPQIFFGTVNSQPFPTSTGSIQSSSFPSQQNFGSTGFPQTGQFNPFGVQLLPGEVPQQQFPGRFPPNFQQGALNTRAQNTGSSTNSSRPTKRNQNGDQSSQTLKETKQDDVYISWTSESRNRKPIRNAPRFLRAEPNATQMPTK